MSRTNIKAKIVMLSIAFLGAAAVAAANNRTIIWSNEEGDGSVGMEHADAAYAYCQPPRVEQAVYPEANNELTACEQEWWNDGHPLPVALGVVQMLQLYAVAEELPVAVPGYSAPPPATVVCSGGAVHRNEL